MTIDSSNQLPPNVDDLLAPFRQQVAECGMTDAELTEFGESLRREVRQLKHEKNWHEG